jgi:hypothetical protein
MSVGESEGVVAPAFDGPSLMIPMLRLVGTCGPRAEESRQVAGRLDCEVSRGFVDEQVYR